GSGAPGLGGLISALLPYPHPHHPVKISNPKFLASFWRE
ncbi:hypothetical protein ACVWXV_002488, partial [Thermostichus sp. OS-CIW-21]